MVGHAHCHPCKLNGDYVSTRTATLYSFPTCPTRRKQWLEILELDEEKIKTGSRVCEQHFKSSQKMRHRLKKDALPVGPFKVPKRSYYQGPALEALKKAQQLQQLAQQQQLLAQQAVVFPKVKLPGSFTIQIEGQPAIQVRQEGGRGGGEAGEKIPQSLLDQAGAQQPQQPGSSSKVITYAIPAMIYVEVDEHGNQKTTVVPQAMQDSFAPSSSSSSGS